MSISTLVTLKTVYNVRRGDHLLQRNLGPSVGEQGMPGLRRQREAQAQLQLQRFGRRHGGHVEGQDAAGTLPRGANMQLRNVPSCKRNLLIIAMIILFSWWQKRD